MVVNDLNDMAPEIEELYVVVRMRDGTSDILMAGTNLGLSWTIQLLTHYIMESLSGNL